MSFNRGSRARLTQQSKKLFTGETLFARVARVVCDAECLPRKELFESWEVARRVRRRLRGGRVLELGAGHGLLGMLLLLLDDTSPTAVAVDTTQPLSFSRLEAAITRAWPRLAGRLSYQLADLTHVEAGRDHLVVSVHACGALSDAAINVAIRGQSRLGLLPCCQDHATCDTGGLESWMDASLAVDARRAMRLEHAGYDVTLTTIPADITPKNRLLIAKPGIDAHPRA